LAFAEVGVAAVGVVEAVEEPTAGVPEDFGPCGFTVAGGVPVGVALCDAGFTGLGADTPAISEPSPSFCKLNASSFPVASKP
jgi:hypothetical protein